MRGEGGGEERGEGMKKKRRRGRDEGKEGLIIKTNTTKA